MLLRRGAGSPSAEVLLTTPQSLYQRLRRVIANDSAELPPTTLGSHHQQLWRVSPGNSGEFPRASVRPPFPDDEEGLILQCVRQIHLTKLETAEPAGDLDLL